MALLSVLGSADPEWARAYPYDGYATTGIRRLERLRLRLEGELGGRELQAGQRKRTADITLSLRDASVPPLDSLTVDSALQREIERLFSDRSENYSLALLDITNVDAPRLALLRADAKFVPGSVGKLLVATGLLQELARIEPEPDARRELLRSRMVTAGRWVISDRHEVPIFDVETREEELRTIREGDVFSLYEWIDHMISASANSAASTVWKEAMLMRRFGDEYPPALEEEDRFFAETPKAELAALALAIVNDPIRELGIPESQWRLGRFFTSEGRRRVPTGGGSSASPRGLLRFLLALEQGRVVDAWSSLELKRLFYRTERLYRYASSPALRDCGIYFKSGSYYSCVSKETKCPKYAGDRFNYMNSVLIVETPEGRRYLVALMSNVTGVNSAVEHQTLGTYIERILNR